MKIKIGNTESVPVKVGNTDNVPVRFGGQIQGTKNYELLFNKPSINGTELIGDRTSDEIHVQHKMNRITEQMIDNLLFGRS